MGGLGGIVGQFDQSLRVDLGISDGAVDAEWVDHLPDHGSDDQDFNWMREVLFEDHDVLMLFNRPG